MSSFLDTNIVVYAQQAGQKGDVARALMEVGGTISAQVLNEFANVLRKKLGRDWASVSEAVEDVIDALGRPVPLTVETHRAALGLAREHGLSLYDALIVASALEAGCDTLWSEDMQHGRAFGRMRISNPFL